MSLVLSLVSPVCSARKRNIQHTPRRSSHRSAEAVQIALATCASLGGYGMRDAQRVSTVRWCGVCCAAAMRFCSSASLACSRFTLVGDGSASPFSLRPTAGNALAIADTKAKAKLWEIRKFENHPHFGNHGDTISHVTPVNLPRDGSMESCFLF